MLGKLEPTPSPQDLDFIGCKFRIPPNRMEELVLQLRAGVSDAEILRDLQEPSDEGGHCFKAIHLTGEQGRALLAGVRRVVRTSARRRYSSPFFG
jgi:hypothetical protein